MEMEMVPERHTPSITVKQTSTTWRKLKLGTEHAMISFRGRVMVTFVRTLHSKNVTKMSVDTIPAIASGNHCEVVKHVND